MVEDDVEPDLDPWACIALTMSLNLATCAGL